MLAIHHGLQIAGNRSSIRHSDTRSDALHHVDHGKPGLVVLRQRYSSLQSGLARIQRIQHAKNVLEWLHLVPFHCQIVLNLPKIRTVPLRYGPTCRDPLQVLDYNPNPSRSG